MAARSTPTQFDTCHTYPSPSQREGDTQVHANTRGPPGVFVFLFVSICSESGTWHLPGEQASPTRPPGLSHVWMQTSAHHGKLIKSKGKVQTLNFTVQYASWLLNIFTNTHTHTEREKLPACIYEYLSADQIFQKAFFFFFFYR